MTDKDEAESSGDEGRTIVDGRKKKKNYAWPPGVYEAIIELKKKDPKRSINADFLKSVNKRCKSGISVAGVNSWWGRHQRIVKVEKAGTSASPGVQKERGRKEKLLYYLPARTVQFPMRRKVPMGTGTTTTSLRGSI